jgi:UDP-3-O-[3-hydroxymyristoyl] glucosamine N-acyltransferase
LEFIRLKKRLCCNDLFSFLSIPDAPACSFDAISQIDSVRGTFLTFFDGEVYQGAVCEDLCPTIVCKSNSTLSLKKSFPNGVFTITEDPRTLFIRLVEDCQKLGLIGPSSGFPENPFVSNDIQLGLGVIIEESVQIDSGVTIGSGAVIRSGTWLKEGVSVGENTVIGGVGINLHVDKSTGERLRFPHLAGVIVGKGASIGANCVVVRGTLTNTFVGENVIISNLCNIGHSSNIGDRSWISSGVLLGGYCSVGLESNIGIGAVVKNGLNLGRRVNVGMGSVVVKSIPDDGGVFGNPARRSDYVKAGPN